MKHIRTLPRWLRMRDYEVYKMDTYSIHHTTGQTSFETLQKSHLRFLLVFFVDAISWSFPDSSNTFSTSRDLHVGQMDIFPVLS